jgi:alpha-tubulin suppressor-like RCC1 family protein
VELDGSLWCWGSNCFALVGDGTTTDRAAPVKVGDGFASVRFGGGFVNDLACGRKTDGSVACWGVASVSDAGVNGIACDTFTCVATPTRVEGIASVAQVVTLGEMEALVLTDDGRVVRVHSVFQSPKQTVIHDVRPY